MKNYIQKVQSFQLSSEQELSLYTRFLEKRQRMLFLSKVKYYTKLAVYSLGLVMIVGSVLFSFPQQSQELYTRILSNKAVEIYSPNPAIVHANTIGKVVSLEGDVMITHDGKEYPLQEIYSDTTVILKQGSILTFQIAGGLQTQLLGPAQFQLHYNQENNNEIILDIQEGRMIQVESSIAQESSEHVTEMTIKTPKLQLASIRSDKKIKLHIDASQENAFIANQGDAVTLTTTDSHQGVMVASLQSQQMVVINDAGRLEQDIISLSKKIIIGDQEITFADVFSGHEFSGNSYTMLYSGGSISESSGVVLPSSGNTTDILTGNLPLLASSLHTSKKSNPEKIIENTVDSGTLLSGMDTHVDQLGTKDLLMQEDFSQLKSQLYAPNLQSSLRTMMIAYARADYQMFLTQKKEISKAIYNLYDILDFVPHIRVIAIDPQLAVRQYQSLIEQLLLSIDRSRGIPPQYVNKMMSIEVTFMIMKSIGYGKFIHSELSDDELRKLIGDEVKKVTK